MKGLNNIMDVTTNLVYYDVTNYYFETDNMDDFKSREYQRA